MNIRCLLFAVSVLGVSGFGLAALDRLAPVILERDREGSVWLLHDLAEQKIEEAAAIKWVATREERQELLVEAAGLLDRVRKMRPDVPHYEYYWRVTDYQAVMMDESPDPERMKAALGRLIELWEQGERQSTRLAGILAYHYRRLSPDPDKALEVLNRWLELDPENRAIYDDLIGVHLERGDRQQAMELLETKCDKEIDTAADRETLAEIHFLLGDWERVRELVAMNLSGGAVSPFSRLALGVVQTLQGNHAQALITLRMRLEESDPASAFPAIPLQGAAGYPGEGFPSLPYLILEAELPAEGENP